MPTYGGVSVLVVIFAAYPVAVAILRNSNTPKRFIPAALLGGATFTLSGITGTPRSRTPCPSRSSAPTRSLRPAWAAFITMLGICRLAF